MKITKLIESLKSVTNDYPDAEYELGFCSCCIYIIIGAKKVAVFNVEEDEFEYLMKIPVNLGKKSETPEG